VLGNIAAMAAAVELATDTEQFGLNDLKAVHRVLMDNSSTPSPGGVIRQAQNWMGGSSFNPRNASFVPPPPECLDDLLADLIEYVNRDDHSPLVQAAIAHAQFETIHPFADSNGRAGGALVHVVLRRRGLAPKFVPQISLVLATWPDGYINALTTFRHVNQPDSVERSLSTTEWLRVLATATSRACRDAAHCSTAIDEMPVEWRTKLGRVRAESSADLLLQVLPGVPIVTVAATARLIGRSKARTTDAVNALAEAGVLRQRNVGRQRYRVFEATDVLDLLTGMEGPLASY